MGLNPRSARRLALALAVGVVGALAAACGGGGGLAVGGGAGNPLPPAGPLRATVLFVDPAPGAAPPAGSAPARGVAAAPLVVAGRAYAADAAGIIRDVPYTSGDRFEFGAFALRDATAPGESLVVSAIRQGAGVAARTTHAAAVYYRAAAGGGLALRSVFAHDATTETLAGPSETAGGGDPAAVIAAFLARSFAAAAGLLADNPPPPVNFSATLSEQTLTFATALTGELTLVVEPRESRLMYGESVRLVAYLRDARGLRAETSAGWSVEPPGVVDLESDGRVNALNVPGTVVVTARHENLTGTASVTILSSVDGTSLSGILPASRDLTPDQDYYIIGDLTIPPGRTLTIQGGTVVRFLAAADNTAAGENPARAEIIVEGTLIAEGLETQNIYLLSSNALNPERSDYLGIRVRPGGTARLSRVRIRDAAYGAKGEGGQLHLTRCRITHSVIGVYATGDCDLKVEGCEITGCVSGIELRQVPTGSIMRNYIADNDWNGVTLYTANPLVWGNLVSRHRNAGISIHTNAYPRVRNNLVSASAVYNVFVDRTARPMVKGNVIAHGPSYGVFLERNSSTELRDNVLHANYRALGFRNGMEMRFSHNVFSSSGFVNFYNVERDNDVYDGPYESGTLANGLYLSGTAPVSVSLLPDIMYGDPRFTRPNWERPHLGDFSLGPTSPFLRSSSTTGPVGLVDAADLGTTSVRIGTPTLY